MANSAPLIAVTGGTGFVGRHVLENLLGRGCEVHALVRPKTTPKLHHPNLTWHRANIGNDNAAFLKNADCLIHIAGVVKAQKREDYFAVNAELSEKLATSAQRAQTDRIVLISSMTAKEPELSDYAASKFAGETAVQAAYDGKLAIIRAPAVFGPGDLATAPFFTAINKGILPVPGGRGWRERKLSLAFAPDLANDIVAAALDGQYDGRIVYPATKPCLTWPEFAAECTNAAQRPVRALPLPLTALYPVAGVTSVTSRLFGMGHLTLGKLGEFLYEDWSSEDLIHGATPLNEAIAQTLSAGPPG